MKKTLRVYLVIVMAAAEVMKKKKYGKTKKPQIIGKKQTLKKFKEEWMVGN